MSAKQNILAKLRHSLEGTEPLADHFNENLVTEPWSYAADERITRLRTMMEAVHTEIHLCQTTTWSEKAANVLKSRHISSLLTAPSTEYGRHLATCPHFKNVTLTAYDRPIEEWRDDLFHNTPASLTGTLGAIASTGSLLVWPTPSEPRLMSLVPPVHIAVLKASTIYNNLYEIMQQQGWADRMPTNLLLISGPSKTADIEQVLAYGAHGPKDLIVLILEDA